MVAGVDQILLGLMRRGASAAAGLVSVAALFFGAACGSGGDMTQDSASPRRPGSVVDSALTPEEAMRRFRVGVDSVGALAGAPSQRALLDAFRQALASRDTAALLRLAIDRAEFAYLIYPESKLSRPPFRQAPDIAWLMLQNASHGGLSKLLQRADELAVLSQRCPDSVQVEGRMRTVSGCTARVRLRDGTHREIQLLGRIVELGGRWKIVGYDGDL